MKRIAIIGPGAIGGVVAGWLGHTGHSEVILCSRRPIPELVVELADRTFTSHPLVLTDVGSSRVDLQACKLEYSIVSPK